MHVRIGYWLLQARSPAANAGRFFGSLYTNALRNLIVASRMLRYSYNVASRTLREIVDIHKASANLFMTSAGSQSTSGCWLPNCEFVNAFCRRAVHQLIKNEPYVVDKSLHSIALQRINL